jgi:predicted RNA binding protein YcfA (HicA-like mRNA interferase family)
LKRKKLLQKILQNQKNVKFDDFINLIVGFGFQESRVSGSHHIFKSVKITELVNIQNVKGKAKPYQIKQFLAIIEKYNLNLEE